MRRAAADFPKNIALFTLIQKTATIGESGGSPSTGATGGLSASSSPSPVPSPFLPSSAKKKQQIESLALQMGSASGGGAQGGGNLCATHKRKLEVVCVLCKERICTNCALFGKHRGHDIRTEEEIFKEISERADYLIEMYDVL